MRPEHEPNGLPIRIEDLAVDVAVGEAMNILQGRQRRLHVRCYRGDELEQRGDPLAGLLDAATDRLARVRLENHLLGHG